jgi:hypothetical protein
MDQALRQSGKVPLMAGFPQTLFPGEMWVFLKLLLFPRKRFPFS